MNFNEAFGKAEWVMPSEENNSPVIRGGFSAKEIEKAEISVCGLGFYYLFINGRKVSDDLFITYATEYHPASADKKSSFYRIIFQKYDVTEYLREGKNAIGFLLGGGYYRYPFSYDEVYGRVKVCFKLEMTDKNGNTVCVYSNESMKWAPSFVKECDNMRTGETQDYSNFRENWYLPDFDDGGWKNTVKSEMPDTYYETSELPADKIKETGKPRLISETENTRLYDMGQNITGWAYIHCAEGVTDEINVRFSEETENGALLEEKSWNQYFKIIPDGKARTYHPFLTWHGFRYAEVPKNAELTEFALIHQDIKPRSEFTSSSEALNWLFATYIKTQLENMHCGIPSDCPTIERRGYTGDGQLCCEAAMLLLDGREFYKKWINDIADSQNRENGHIPYTAPFINSGGGPGGWGCAIVEVPYVYYRTYGDSQILKANFNGMLKYFDFLDSHSENGLVVSDMPGFWCLGDWCTALKTEIPEPFVNTYFYVKALTRAIEIAKAIGREDKITNLEEKRDYLKTVICEKYYNRETGDFANGIQGANAFALDIGLGDKKTLENTVAFYNEYKMFDTGIFGTDILLRVLFENDCGDTALALLESDGKYSFVNWMKQGATTLWEYWTAERSHNHPMFGACTRYLIQYILGIRQRKGDAGFKKLLISPAKTALQSASGSLVLENGRLAVSYTRENGKIKLKIIVPNGVEALFSYGKEEISLKCGENILECSDN